MVCRMSRGVGRGGSGGAACQRAAAVKVGGVAARNGAAAPRDTAAAAITPPPPTRRPPTNERRRRLPSGVLVVAVDLDTLLSRPPPPPPPPQPPPPPPAAIALGRACPRAQTYHRGHQGNERRPRNGNGSHDGRGGPSPSRVRRRAGREVEGWPRRTGAVVSPAGARALIASQPLRSLSPRHWPATAAHSHSPPSSPLPSHLRGRLQPTGWRRQQGRWGSPRGGRPGRRAVADHRMDVHPAGAARTGGNGRQKGAGGEPNATAARPLVRCPSPPRGVRYVRCGHGGVPQLRAALGTGGRVTTCTSEPPPPRPRRGRRPSQPSPLEVEPPEAGAGRRLDRDAAATRRPAGRGRAPPLRRPTPAGSADRAVGPIPGTIEMCISAANTVYKSQTGACVPLQKACKRTRPARVMQNFHYFHTFSALVDVRLACSDQRACRYYFANISHAQTGHTIESTPRPGLCAIPALFCTCLA